MINYKSQIIHKLWLLGNHTTNDENLKSITLKVHLLKINLKQIKITVQSVDNEVSRQRSQSTTIHNFE